VQLVDPVHQLQISILHRSRLVIDAAPADLQHDGLSNDAEPYRGIDHLFTLGNRPALPSAPDKKTIIQRQLSDLGMLCFHVDHWHQISLRGFAKNACRTFEKLVTPLLDLVRM
jgi:hypothetical protein